MLGPSALDTIMLDAHSTDDQTKVDLDSLCLYPHGAVQIIQLIEVSPPTPRKISSPYAASLATSSQSSEYSSESEYSEYSTNDDDEDADVCSSYCSSAEAQEQMDSLRCDDEGVPRLDETYDIRATRVHAWRTKFADDMTPEALPAKAAKRKSIDLTEVYDDAVLLPHKRSRPDLEYPEEHDTIASMHICAACDASFTSAYDLRHHGEASQTSEACRTAVEYGFE